MVLATNAFATFQAAGNREDLSDVIYRIDPTDTPFYSNLNRETATATLHEWQTQSLASPATTNAAIEGDDNVAADTVTPTVRLGNVLQIQTKIPRVTGTQRVVDSAGRGDEMDYEVMLKGLELKRDVEATFLNNQTLANPARGNSSTARTMAGVDSWIKTNTDQNTNGVNPSTIGTTTRTDGTPRQWTEQMLKNVLQKCFSAGGKPDTIMTGPFNKQIFSVFVGRGTPFQDQADRTITAAADIYESDFGRLRCVPNRFQRARDVFCFQMDMWASAALTSRNFISFDLAKTGDTDRRQILVEHTLVARNEAASGGIFDLTTT